MIDNQDLPNPSQTEDQLHFLSALEQANQDTEGSALPSAPSPPVDKITRLTQLAQTCGRCKRCELHKGRTQSVFSDGNPEAEIMVIGEGPGYNEDQTGIPFVGQAGQLLTKILASVQLDRQQDTYIANVVKCRPPNNRTPSPQEMAACVPFLKEQIRLIKPKIIILAGGTAVKGLLRDQRGITRLRGQWLEWEGIPCMPTFHPSYLLRNESRAVGSPKWQTWQDMKAAIKRFKEIKA